MGVAVGVSILVLLVIIVKEYLIKKQLSKLDAEKIATKKEIEENKNKLEEIKTKAIKRRENVKKVMDDYFSRYSNQDRSSSADTDGGE